MANTLTNLAPVIYAAARNVPRELVGMIGAVRRDFTAEGIAKGDTVKVTVAPAMSSADVTPSQTFTAGSDRTPTTKSVTLTNYKEVSWHLTAEEERTLMNAGVAQDLLRQTIEQGMRTLVNAIELHTWQVAYKGASRAAGTAGTTPFASNLNALNDVRKILVDNGVMVNPADCSLVINTAAGVNLRNLSSLQKVNESGDSDVLRQGVLSLLGGFAIRESGQITTHTKGAATGGLINNASGEAIGQTTLTLDTITVNTTGYKAGDIITHASDSTNKYVVNTGLVATSGDIVIGDPGLLVAANDNDAITVGNNYTPNVALHRNAIVLIARPALQPEGGGIEQMVITDPVSGLSFLLLRVVGNGMASWYLRIVYEASPVNGFAIATLMG